jgi:hypothetical protein
LEAGFSNELGRTSGREEANIVLDQAFGEVEKTRFVVDGQDCCTLVRRSSDGKWEREGDGTDQSFRVPWYFDAQRSQGEGTGGSLVKRALACALRGG